MREYRLHKTANTAELVLQEEAVARLLNKKNGDAALLYLAILKNGQTALQEEILQQLGWTQTELCRAERVLQEMGMLLIRDSVLDSDITPTPSISDGFTALIDVTERKLGKMLSSADLTRLLSLRKDMHLPDEVIELLIDFCVEDVRRKYGKGRKPTMRQIEQEGSAWSKKGLTEYGCAAAYIENERRKTDLLPRMMQLFGLGNRTPSPVEVRFLTKWAKMGFSDEVLQFAYDKSLHKCQELNWAYVDKILTIWDDKGLYTLAEVQSEAKPNRNSPHVPSNTEHDTYQTHPSFEDIARMEKLLKRMREEGQNEPALESNHTEYF